MGADKEKYINKSTFRTLRILQEFGACEGSLGITEISERLSLTKNLVHRSLGVLVDEGLLLKNPTTRRYELGPGILWLANARTYHLDIKQICMPFMVSLEELTGMTVSLQLLVGQFQIPVQGVDGRRSGLTRIVEGVPVPLHISSGSRAILANLGDQQIEAYIRDQTPLKGATRNTLTDPDKLRANLKLTREEGFARGIEDHFLGVRAVAFPVFGGSGEPLGSLTIVGAATSVSDEEIDAFVPEIAKVVSELNQVVNLHSKLPTRNF